MNNRVAAIPKGYHSVTPSLVVNGASGAIEFYKKAFGAVVEFRLDRKDGKVLHAAIRIGDSIIMLADECRPHKGHNENCVRPAEALKGTTVNLYLYVKDADAVFKKAIAAGGKEIVSLMDMFYGDRIGLLKDPFGHLWTVATQKEHVSFAQLKARMAEFCALNPAVC